MLVFFILFSIATEAGAQCYGLDRTNGDWNELVKIYDSVNFPISDGTAVSLTCIIGTISDTTKKALCKSSDLVLADGSTNTEITSTADKVYPTCAIGSLTCNSDGTIRYDFSGVSVTTVTYEEDTILQECGTATSGSVVFNAGQCNPTYSDSSSDHVEITNELKVTLSTPTASHSGQSVNLSPKVVTIKTTCQIPKEKIITEHTVPFKSKEVEEIKSYEVAVGFTFEVITDTVKDDDENIIVVAGDRLSFKISPDTENIFGADTDLKFWLKDLKVKISGFEYFTIVTDGCADDAAEKIDFVPQSDKTLGNGEYTFTLKMFEIPNLSVFELEATVSVCSNSCPNTPAACDNVPGKISTYTNTAKVRRSTQLEPIQDDIHLSTGPFVFLSKDQISGAKAVGWMLPLTIFNTLLFLQYL